MISARSRSTVFCTVLVVLTLGLPRLAGAPGFVSPLLGDDFRGGSGCPEIAGCEDKHLNIGVGIGTFGTVLGVELELSYARNFFGEASARSSSVLTLMSDVLLGPRIGPVRPYGTGGIGRIKTHVDFTPAALLESDNNHWGWNIGGGVMIFPTEHVGVRGDMRHFHAFQDLNVPGLPLENTKLDFGRASAALVLRF